jgi:hypothetical protein
MADRGERRCPASPGVVGKDEKLAFGVYSPEVFDGAKLTIAAFGVETLAPKGGHEDNCGNSTGISMNRIEKPGGLEDLARTLRTLVSRQRQDGVLRRTVGHAVIQAHTVGIVGEGLLYVVDDGCECNTTHTVIRSDVPFSKKASLRGVRNKLVEALNENVVRY